MPNVDTPEDRFYARTQDTAEALQIAAAALANRPHAQPEARHLVALVQMAAEERREGRREERVS